MWSGITAMWTRMVVDSCLVTLVVLGRVQLEHLVTKEQ